MTIGKDITTKITETLCDAKKKGAPIVPCGNLWNAVRSGRSVSDPFYGRYRSVLAELLQQKKIKMHRDEETGKPAGFESLTCH